MSFHINIHPGGPWVADVRTRNETIWTTVRGANEDDGEVTFFFRSRKHAQAVADAFNNPPPQPENGDN